MAVKLVEQRVPRGDATRHALMKAAEQLFAEKGPSNVTIREIVEKAGQKNESALQYHFKNMEGLILATHRFRDQQIVDARMAFLEGLERKTDDPSLRDVVEVMVRPTFMLCRESSEFRRYIRAFSLMLASGNTSTLASVRRGSGESDDRIAVLLRQVLPQLDSEGFERRLNSAIRFISVSMYSHSHQTNAFQGKVSDLFFSHLMDTLVGLLSADESKETLKLSREVAVFEGRSSE